MSLITVSCILHFSCTIFVMLSLPSVGELISHKEDCIPKLINTDIVHPGPYCTRSAAAIDLCWIDPDWIQL